MVKQFLLLVFLSFNLTAFSQASYTTNPSLEDINNLLQTEGITVYNLELVAGNPILQLALVTNAIEGANLEIDQGLFFSTGDVEFDLSNKNSTRNRSGVNTQYVDVDLLAIEGNAFYDPVILEFFIQLDPGVNTLTFSYQFGSEEYPDYVGSIYNDVFAIFFKEVGQENYQNIALIPSTANATSVNFINGGVLGAANDGQQVDLSQTDSYINNGHLNTGAINPPFQPGPFPVHIEYNGLTKKISSKVSGLDASKNYQVKFAIADTADPNFDSGVLFSPISASTETISLRLEKDGYFSSLSNENRAEVGDEITYEFRLINDGEVPLYDFSFADEMFQAINPLQNLTSLLPNEEFNFELTYSITQNDINNGVVHNLALVNAGLLNQENSISIFSVDPTPLDIINPFKDLDCLDCTSVLIPQDAQLGLIKRGFLESPNDVSKLGDKILYEFDMVNLGNVDLFDVRIEDSLPDIQIDDVLVDLSVNEMIENVAYAMYSIRLEDLQRGEVINQAQAFGFTWIGEEVVAISDIEVPLLDRPTVVSLNTCELEIYNAITPNNDGVNDFLFIEGIQCYPNNLLKVFNRWGVEVFSATNYTNEGQVFDGNSNGRATVGSGQKLPDGVYYYVFQYENLEGASETRKGSIYLTRGE